jgi:hypothetical protein
MLLKCTVFMPQKELRQHVAAHILKDHIPHNACGCCGDCGTPPTLVAKARGMQAGAERGYASFAHILLSACFYDTTVFGHCFWLSFGSWNELSLGMG